MKRRLGSVLFRKYFLITTAIIISCFIFIAGSLTILVPAIWMNEKSELLEENALSVTKNAKDVLASDYLVSRGRGTIAMICNNLTQISDAIEADIFIVNEEGKVVYCKDILSSDGPHYDGHCTIHDQYVIPESVMDSLKDGSIYHSRGKMEGLFAKNNIIVGCPLTVNDEFRGAVIAAQPISNGLRIYISTIFRMFSVSSVFALIFSFILNYIIAYRLIKPLVEMSEAAKEYADGNFSKRISIPTKKLFKHNEIEQLAEAFNAMASSLEANEASRKNFVSNVSHELKTPMTTIGGFIDGILDGTIEKENQDKYLKIISDEVKRLSRLVTGMLNMSKIEAGQLDIKPVKFDISDMLFRTLLSFEQLIEKKNIEITGLEEISENSVFADKDMINQVVFNLIDNAVKFTPEGGYINISSKRDSEKAIIKIRNSGKGIEADELPRIFDRFYKIDKSRSYDVKGAGMGLFIVKTIVELHGGNITAQSIPGSYSEFIFTLPV